MKCRETTCVKLKSLKISELGLGFFWVGFKQRQAQAYYSTYSVNLCVFFLTLMLLQHFIRIEDRIGKKLWKNKEVGVCTACGEGKMACAPGPHHRGSKAYGRNMIFSTNLPLIFYEQASFKALSLLFVCMCNWYVYKIH